MTNPLWISRQDIENALPYPELVARLREGFRTGATCPPRMIYDLSETARSKLLAMPFWKGGVGIGIKVMTSFPGNAAHGIETGNAVLLIFSEATGRLSAILEGKALTQRRTAATSALASTWLSNPASRTLSMLGTGALAPYMVAAHCAVRPIDRVLLWGRSRDKTQSMARSLRGLGPRIVPVQDADEAVASGDIITTATRASAPIIKGELVRPGAHVDLVGSFTADMRESDAALFSGARVVVDERTGALRTGDLIAAIAAGTLNEADIEDLGQLASMEKPEPRDPARVTVFKSVGSAIADLYAARLVLERQTS